MTKEPFRGVEALRDYSFRDVVLPKTTGLDVLTGRTRHVVVENLFHIIPSVNPRDENAQGLVTGMKTMQADVDSYVSPGGLSIKPNELEIVYNELGDQSYAKVIETFTESIFPTWMNDPKKHPGPTAVGYLLDLLSLLDPKIANFSDGVQIIVDQVSKPNAKLHPLILGGMVDDALHMRGSEDGFPHLFSDRIGTAQFRDTFLGLATPGVRDAFNKGLNVTLNKLTILTTGNSLN